MLIDSLESASAFALVLKATLVVLAVLVVAHVVIRFAARSRGDIVKYRWTIPERLIYLGFVLNVGVLGTTAFYSVLVAHGMHGWWLLAHMGGAGGFVATITLMSWTVSFRFMIGGAPTDESGAARIRFPLPVKLSYWLILVLSLPVMGTMLLSMFPFAGTEDMLKLIDLHRYSGLALFSAVAVQCLLIALPPR